ncbi:MAG: hypothetical protein IKA87_04930 [Lentisphaeria bacterium]|nr:hypothetical protein [Lentisphaeria bacterium]
MNSQLKKLLSTPKGQLVAALSALGLVWLILLIVFGSEFIGNLPSTDNLDDARRELKKQQRLLEKAKEDERQYLDLRAKYNEKIRSAWHEAKYGMVETRLRQMISETATGLELKPNSLGTVRTNRINEDFFFAEIDIAMNATYEEVVKFIDAVAQCQPKLSWRRLDLRPDFRRRNMRANNTNLAAARAAAVQDQNAVNVMFSGVIRVIGYDGANPNPGTLSSKNSRNKGGIKK